MLQLRRHWLRAYPTVVFYWLIIANRVFALDVSAVDKDGAAPPEGALRESYQGLEVAIHDQVAAVHGAYRFKSEHAAELELTCLFRLGQQEMVDGFSYWNGTEKVVGEVLEKQAATQVYEQLTGVRRDPGILEQEGDRFRFRVFPIAPKEEKSVELTSVAPLAMREGFIEYVVPKENLPHGKAVFSLHATITDSLPIRDVETLGFQGRIERRGAHEVRVVFETEGQALTQDLKIRYRLAADDYAMRIVTHREGSGDGSFMLIVSPKAAVAAKDVIGRDIVFVTDVSGSMEGTPLQQSKLGLQEILRKLSPKDRFEVISFDDDSYTTFGELVEATKENREIAARAVHELAVKGGTNIHGALSSALNVLKNETAGRPRAIVFLTDGQGDAPPEVVLADMRDRAGSVRIYSFGAGSGVNRNFLERLAQDNRGTATFVQDDTQIGAEMQRLYSRISMPLMVDLALDFGGLVVSASYPKRMPDLYRDGEVVVLGRYKPGAGKITLKGETNEGAKTLSIDVDLPAQQVAHGYVEKLWAKQRIDSLLGTIELRGTAPELEQEVTRLGIVYNIATPYTTFLAVPESVKTAEVKAAIRDGKLGYDKKLIDTLKGIELSQTAIPPGDPVLSVDAPADAREVTAYFPFGLVKQLAYDEQRQHWYVRFLVPRDVEDGVYTIMVRIVDAHGSVKWRDIDYVIDGTAPELEVRVVDGVAPGETIGIAVDPLEPVKSVYVTLPGVSNKRIALTLDVETGLYEGEVLVPEDFAKEELKLRVVAVDRARNRVQQEVKINVYFEEGC